MNKFVLATIILLVLTPVVSAKEWVVDGSELKPAVGKKKASPASLQLKEKLFCRVAVTKSDLKIALTNGKQKFGAPSIRIKNGENTYLRPRLNLLVPLTEALEVAKDKPTKVISFMHEGEAFEIDLVANDDGTMPNVVVTKK